MELIMLILKSLRVRQWTKNLFIFLPIVFGGKLFDSRILAATALTFLLFCLASGGVYLFNDIKDMKKDKYHPVKCERPIASGRLGIGTAYLFLSVLFLISLGVSFLTERRIFWVILSYILLHIVYSVRLKKEVILDVILIAFGFELRVWGGAVAAGLRPSVWLQLCIFVLALFLGFVKRRHEKVLLYKHDVMHRGVLSHYKVYFLDQMIIISAALCVVFYSLYTVSPEIISRIGWSGMTYTVPFVVYGVFRYLYLVHVKKIGGDPGEVLLTDFPFILNIMLWITAAIFLVYSPFN